MSVSVPKPKARDRRFPTLIASAFLFVHFVSSGVFAELADGLVVDSAAAELWERYQKESPLVAEEIASVTVRLRYRIGGTRSVTRKTQADPDATESDGMFSSLTLREGFMKRAGPRAGGQGIESIMAMNESYAFRISKSPQRGEYAISWLEPLDSWGLVPSGVSAQRAEALAEALGYWYLYGIPFYELATSDSCRVTEVSTESKENRTYLRVDFETQRKGREPSTNYALLDPERGWAPVETKSLYQVNTEHPEWKAEYAATVEFGESVDGLPIAKQKTETWTSKNWMSDHSGPDIVQQRITTVEVLGADDISPE